jgi:Flp pilus assembly protein TadD
LKLRSFSSPVTPQEEDSRAMWRSDISAALLLVILLTGCGTIGGSTRPAANLDKATVSRVANIVKQSGEYGAAARIQASYAAAHPDDPAAQVSSGEAALQAGEIDKALENFKRAVQLAPGQIDAHYGLARTYLSKNQPNEAAVEFQTVLTAEPRHVRALNGVGIALDLLGRGREAQAAYRAALVIAPNDRAVRNNLGLSLMLSGDYGQAVAELSALARQPNASTRMRQNLALALGLKGDETGAARTASRDLDPTAIAENQRFFTAVRRLAAPGTAAMQSSGNTVATVTSY